MRRGLAETRHQAAELVDRGVVRVAGAVADKPARMVAEAEPLSVVEGRRFVSRGGEKLDAALDGFAVEARGRRCLDVGSSTGGFTDCLLQRGASHVVAVDVARAALHPRLREDERVTSLERANLRHLDLASTGNVPFGLVVADLSFISLTKVAELLVREMAAPGADLVVLVKPQFEVGKDVASRGRGVVRDPAERRAALERVARALLAARSSIMGAMASPLLGPAGNAEYFLHARSAGDDRAAGLGEMLDAAVAGSPDSGRA